MWEKYKETFDGVHASQRLKTEVLNMKREENVTKRRRVPAVLAAAVLVIALAGTALAVELFSQVTVNLVEPDEAGVSTEGYLLQVEHEPIPLESLSEEALKQFARGDAADHINRYEGVAAGFGTWYFDSWAEAESFLGVDLGQNTLLEQYPETLLSKFETWGCVLGCSVLDDGKVPAEIALLANYQIENCDITVSASIEVDSPAAEDLIGRRLGQWEALLHVGTAEDRYTTEDEQYTTEQYVTPAGLNAAIISRSGTQVGPAVGESSGYDLQISRAYFIKNNAFYCIDCRGTDHEQETALLKEILDAYE